MKDRKEGRNEVGFKNVRVGVGVDVRMLRHFAYVRVRESKYV